MMLLEGMKLGFLVQLAVGPICLMIFNVAIADGVGKALTLVAAVSIVVSMYISLTGFGITKILANKKVEKLVRIIGALVLFSFGANNIVESFAATGIKVFSISGADNIFFQGLLLTISNPLTIIFWGGVLSAQIVEKKLAGKSLLWFCIGCILATITFLIMVAVLGSIVGSFLSPVIIKMLNIFVGIFLIYFAFKLLKK